MSNAMTAYKDWLESDALSDEEKAELKSIANNPKEIEERFFAPLNFGTAGLRGTMAVGLHNMNRHIVAHITQAFANLILSEGKDALTRGVAIAYDSRHNSKEFAREAACILAGNGIHVKLFYSLRPTPELSFAVREYNCIAGINITASHNPKQYNGYKVYWEDGAQLPPEHADVIAQESANTPMFKGLSRTDYDTALRKGLITIRGAETDRDFLNIVMCQSITQDSIKKVAERMRIVYTPFHGAGHDLVPRALMGIGFKYILPVPEQMTIDGEFPTVKSPNPEDKEGFNLAIAIAQTSRAELIIGTDPDADRVGVLVRTTKGGYWPLSGNQIGVLLLDYIITARREKNTMPNRPALLKTIVSTEMAAEIAKANGVAVFDTFTGFKFMAEKIKEFEEENSYKYIFAFEESYGYLTGDHARDKDAVVASMLIAEMTAYHQSKEQNLLDVLEKLYVKYGYFSEETINLVMPGVDGLEKMNSLMTRLRKTPPKKIAETVVSAMRDYQSGTRYDFSTGKPEASKLFLSGSNVISYELSDGTQFMVRPSGTEPKIKVYIKAKGTSSDDVSNKLLAYGNYARKLAD